MEKDMQRELETRIVWGFLGGLGLLVASKPLKRKCKTLLSRVLGWERWLSGMNNTMNPGVYIEHIGFRVLGGTCWWFLVGSDAMENKRKLPIMARGSNQNGQNIGTTLNPKP